MLETTAKHCVKKLPQQHSTLAPDADFLSIRKYVDISSEDMLSQTHFFQAEISQSYKLHGSNIKHTLL